MNEIEKYVHNMCEYAKSNNKRFIIWGYTRGGAWIKKLIEQCDVKIPIDYIIDEKKENIYGANITFYRSSVLQYINCGEYLVVSTVASYDEVIKITEKYDIEAIDFRGDIGRSYLSYLEKRNANLDFSVERYGKYHEWGEENGNHVPLDYACVDDIFIALKDVCKDEVALFDFGCGKCGVLVHANRAGINTLGGVELIEEIYQQGVNNCKELEIGADLIQGDATLLTTELDKYNVFFFYNPFNGSIFERVIENIHNSYIRKKRKVWLVYGNPYDHNTVVKDNYFSLIKQIKVDMHDPLLNFYCNES